MILYTPRWEGNVVVIDSKRSMTVQGQQVEITGVERWSVSEDGKTMTVDSKMAGHGRVDHESCLREAVGRLELAAALSVVEHMRGTVEAAHLLELLFRFKEFKRLHHPPDRRLRVV